MLYDVLFPSTAPFFQTVDLKKLYSTRNDLKATPSLTLIKKLNIIRFFKSFYMSGYILVVIGRS